MIELADNEHNYRARNFIIEIYNDWDNYNDILSYIKKYYKYLAIVHDKDIWTSKDYAYKKQYCDEHNIKIGDLKKVHCHIVVLFSESRYINTIAKELNMTYRFIEPLKKKYIYALRYLTHEDNHDKYHYPLYEVFGDKSLYLKLKKSIGDDEEQEDKVINIIKLIHSNNYSLSITGLTIQVCNAGLYGIFRQNYNLFKDILIEHNNQIYIEKNNEKIELEPQEEIKFKVR